MLACGSSFELLRRDTHFLFKFGDASLHLKEARVGSVGVVIEDIELTVDLGKSFLLVPVLSLDLLSQLVLLIQRCVLAFDDVHHENGSAGVLLSADDLDLAPMVLEFGDDVNQHLLKTFKLAAEGHVLSALKTKDRL